MIRSSAQGGTGEIVFPTFFPANPASDEVKSVVLEVVDRPPRRNPPHRPATLTGRVFLRVCHNIERGFSVPNACDLEGISYRNFRRRVQYSARLAKRLEEAVKVRFDLRHEEMLRIITDAAHKSWPAAAWLLERSIPHMYALRNVTRPDPSDEQSEPEIPAEVLARHRALLLELAREDEARASTNLTQGESVA